MILSNREWKSLLRNDFSTYIERSFAELNAQKLFMHNFHIDVVASKLEACRRALLRRLIVLVPPRSLKSHMASICFPTWLLGHNPAAQIISVTYGQDLSNAFATDCRNLMQSRFYQSLFPGTRLTSTRPAIEELRTTENGFRLATSVGGVLTGRGADFIIIDDPLKPEEALSEASRKRVNDSYDHTLITRLNDKRTGCIIIIMQRLHEDDLVGHVLSKGEEWEVVRFPAIAEETEEYIVPTPFGTSRTYRRQPGQVLHPDREPLEVLQRIRRTQGEYNFAAQYQQNPAPLGGGMVKEAWFKRYDDAKKPEFDYTFQSWDTANKAGELSDFSVCTTWGKKGKDLYLLHVFRERLLYPELKRAVVEQAKIWNAKVVIIEDKGSGTQLIQDLTFEGMYGIQRYQPTLEKPVRLHTVTNLIENGFVYLPEKAHWLPEYLHELTTFPNSKFDDQTDSTSQALDWIKQEDHQVYGVLEYQQQLLREHEQSASAPPRADLLISDQSDACPSCGDKLVQRIVNGFRCGQCGQQWYRNGPVRALGPSRRDLLNEFDRWRR